MIVTGCGTSEHAAMAAAAILRDAWRSAGLPGRGPVSAQAFELSLDPPADGLVIGVSHEGATTATIAAMSAARAAGARTALLTGSQASPAADGADPVLATVEMDRSWCHTVGYVSPIVAATVVADLLAGGDGRSSGLGSRLLAGIEAAHRTGAERISPGRGDRGDDRRRPARARDRHGRRPDRSPGARPEDRGGVVGPGRGARPRDVPPRPPARDRAEHRGRAHPHRAHRPRRADEARATGAGRRGRAGDPARGHRGRRCRRGDPRRAHARRADRGARGARTAPGRPRRCSGRRGRCSWSRWRSRPPAARTPTRSAATIRATSEPPTWPTTRARSARVPRRRGRRAALRRSPSRSVGSPARVAFCRPASRSSARGAFCRPACVPLERVAFL